MTELYNPSVDDPGSEILMPMHKTIIDDLVSVRTVLDEQNVPDSSRFFVFPEVLVLLPNDFIHLTRDELARVKWKNRKWHRAHPGMVLLKGVL